MCEDAFFGKRHTIFEYILCRLIRKLDDMETGINLSELRQSFSSGRTRDAAWRKSQLRAILRLLDENENQIFQALQRDLGKHPIEVYRDEVRDFNYSFFLEYPIRIQLLFFLNIRFVFNYSFYFPWISDSYLDRYV